MSDSLYFINTALTQGNIDIPRYIDTFAEYETDQETPQETTEQIYAKFDKLRR